MRYHEKKTPKKPLRVDFVISVDRCMMSNHHGKEFIGFMATGPAIGVPEKVWRWIACPAMKVDEHGRPWQAPYGLRKIEAALQDAGFNAHIIDPDYVAYYVTHGAKALLIGHHDYFAFGPPSNEWWMVSGHEPINRKSFIDFISMPEIWKAKKEYGLRVVVGGPAVWQWEVWREALERWPVDTLVDGEAEKIIVKLAEKIVNGEELPRKVVVPPQESPKIEEIPLIKAPSVNGLVEIMRGCPRGCKFCSVTLRPLRFMPLERIEAEIRLNLENGTCGFIYHSEDVLLYGADVVKPREEPLIKLHKLAAKYLEKYEAGFAWSHASLAAVKYAEEHGRIVSKIAELVLDGDVRKILGVEVGIETGSVRLAKKIMPAKAAPYPAEKWPDIVEDAFRIMADNNIVPAATFILGLPGETEQDVYETIEVIERLRPYPSLIVPMFFVPMGMLKDLEGFRREYLRDYHIDAMKVAADHTIKWARYIISRGYLDKPQYAPLRAALKLFLWYAEKKIRKAYEYYRNLFSVPHRQAAAVAEMHA
ncbi:radical SAM protein [Pyrofollis japonicus]|uniref:B12-binding domain-containing radical SAM protein n=1 Tax=Pyrofollis japonicus TaxID=3060460 RepID=UPI00295B6A77|nr:radical SAM protein [Pyrofollis japonicus]BEP18700.1 radical SAM protein [Pyrofollis japonicus]